MSHRHGQEGPSLRSIAEPARIVSHEAPSTEVDRLFVEHPELTCVVAEGGVHPLRIVTRRTQATEMTGRLGYGRALHTTRGVGSLAFAAPALVVEGATSLVEAGRLALSREPRDRYEDLIVRDRDGSLRTLGIASLCSKLVDPHAEQAMHDRLTGLPNRELLISRLETALRAGPGSPRPCVLFIDIDDFKHVNDSLGHPAGDSLLVAVGERLRSAFRAQDTIARVGGDEFVVLLSADSEEDAVTTADRVLLALASPFVVDEHRVRVTGSIGIAAANADGSVEELLRNADLALCAAKREGKSRFALYEPSMHVAAMAELELRADLPAATEAGQLRLVYQPIVDLRTGIAKGVEALVRWEHPIRGTVAPLEFIPLAEQTGAIVEIGRWVLETACRQMRAWEDEAPGAADLMLGVNVSPRELQVEGFVGQVARTLLATGLPPERLTLEITETAFARDDMATVATLHALDQLGVRLAIDDFGAGYSSLRRVQGLPVGLLKIDKAFVDPLGTAGPGLVRCMLDLAQALGVQALAEGIEDAGQLEALEELGCELGQGYHLSRPLPPAAVPAWLAAQLPLAAANA
ncbi:MAG: EAL domain-containing protein [Solirubrobacteraceae bacterium MAG38_C4-C5]|nr:EAL domain-containing protein [Candidatus Siliceabacter maunaloa]